jgi:hypothetical protein
MACCILLYSCVLVHLLCPGFVQIYPDRSHHALPKLEYRFYSEDTCLVRESDDEGNFEGEFFPGVYRVLATNVDAPGVAFSGLERFDKATASAQPTVNSGVYSVVVERLEVPDDGTVRIEPLPALLTKQLVLVFSLLDGLDTEVTSLSGELPGVYPSVYLATGLPSEESVEQSPSTSVRFSVAGQGVQREAEIGLFGLRNPGAEPTYTNDLSLTLTLYNGREKATTIPLTTILSDIISGNNGKLPVHVSFLIELTRQVDDIKGGIKAWTDGSEETIKVK